jgi:hypothetical protein
MRSADIPELLLFFTMTTIGSSVGPGAGGLGRVLIGDGTW